MKIYELSKELGVETKDVIEYLATTSDVKRNHLYKLSDEEEQLVRDKFKTAEQTVVKETIVEKILVKKEQKKFNLDDLIPCRCVRNNRVIALSAKTGMRYTWSGFGDMVEVYYSDLLAWKSSKSTNIFAPKIMIEDADLVENWSHDIKGLYEQFIGLDNPEEFFTMSDQDFESMLRQSNKTIQSLVATTAYKLEKEKRFDSVQKLRIIDEVLGTMLKEFI